jgi:hypothetical protein
MFEGSSSTPACLPKWRDSKATGNSLFGNILPVSPYTSIFCGRSSPSQFIKSFKNNNLNERPVDIALSDPTTAHTNSLFSKILPVSPVDSRFWPDPGLLVASKSFRTNILQVSSEKKRRPYSHPIKSRNPNRPEAPSLKPNARTQTPEPEPRCKISKQSLIDNLPSFERIPPWQR